MKKTNGGQKFCQFLRAAFAVCAVLVFGVGAAQAANFTVTSGGDSGAGSLREAITASNTSAGVTDTITFSGVTTITLVTPLPAITDTVTIDGGVTPTVELNGFGTQGAGNASIGLWIRAGGCMVRGLVINRFGEAGIRMDTDMMGTDNGNTIIGNRIGTNIAGTMAMGNINRGILIVGTTGHNIGDGTAAGRNLISGNAGRGVEITAGGAAIIRGNYIGTNTAGTGDVGNTEHGVWIVFSSNSVIGGTTVADRNVISGNNANGVTIIADIGQPATNNTIQGNYIGVDSGGNTALANNGSGVLLQAANNLVGSTAGGGARNIISGNAANGVSISTTLATGNRIAGNAIGVGANGTTAIANANDGIRISSQAANNLIGGTGITPGMCNNSCNIIANNGAATSTTARAGVYVDPTSGTGNQLRSNSIFGNLGIGIDIGTSGATVNDAGDPDTGANNLQNKPVVTTATTGGGVTGTLNSTPSTTFTIDVYRNDATDAQTGEGRTFVSSTTLTTDATGNGTFTTQAGATLTLGQYVAATATRANSPNDTSEISDGVMVSNGPGAPGLECDVFPRENPDRAVDSTDVGQVRRFQLGFDMPYLSGEFQRADCALFAQLGDGGVDALDVGQARRYQLGQDDPQTAGGPMNPAALTNAENTKSKQSKNASDEQSGSLMQETMTVKTKNGEALAPREIRVVTQTANPGATINVVLETDAMGDESIYGFSLNYNTSILTLVPNSVMIGSGATRQAGGMCDVQSNATTAGRIGFSVDCVNSTITAGNNRRFVTLQFTVAANAPNGATPLTFGDTPTSRSVSSNPASGPIMALPTTFTNGNVNIAGSTRVVRVVSQNAVPGSTITVVLEADAMGDESIYGFSLNYATSVLTYVPNSVAIGSGATRQAGGMCDVLANTNTAGQFGFSVDCSNSTISAGNNRPLVTLQFTVAANAAIGSTPLTFGDAPAVRRVSSNPATGPVVALPTTFTNGTVNVVNPTREVRVVSQNTTAGSTITVVLEADTQGDESIYGFSLNYNTSILTYVPNSITIGSGATRQAGGPCNVQSNTNTAGQFGFSVDCSNSTITRGNNRSLVTLQFTVAANAPNGSTPLTFGDTPTSRSVSSNPVAGPIRALTTTFVNGTVNIGSTRVVRVLSQDTSRGATVTVVLEADAMGDESIYGFSLNYDTSILTFVPNSVMIGSGATRQAGGMCDVLANPNTVGRVGFSVDCSNSTITAGNNRRFVTLQFTVATNAPFGQTPLEYVDSPARRSVSSNPSAGSIMALPTVFIDGFLNIVQPTAASVSISGRVSTADDGNVERAAVYLTDSNGTTRRTLSNSFGNYRFDGVAAGETYTVSVSHKENNFAARLVTVNEAVENFNFRAQP